MALDFIAGCFGGCAGVLVGHPFDTVKVRIQTQDPNFPKYYGTFHCFKKILHEESIRGLYKGMTSPLLGVAAVNAIVFGVYGNVQRRMEDQDALRTHFLSGALAGMVQSLVVGPMELAKTRVQIQGQGEGLAYFTKAQRDKILYKGPVDCIMKIYHQHGWRRGVFKGLGITVLRDTPGFGLFFLSYEMLTTGLVGKDQTLSTFHLLMAGGAAGIFSWITTYPLDVVKSRLQVDGNLGITRYDGIWDCARKSYMREGFAVFTRGLNSTIIRAFPTNAATLVVVAWTFRIFGSEEENAEGESSATSLLEAQTKTQSLTERSSLFGQQGKKASLINYQMIDFQYLRKLSQEHAIYAGPGLLMMAANKHRLVLPESECGGHGGREQSMAGVLRLKENDIKVTETVKSLCVSDKFAVSKDNQKVAYRIPSQLSEHSAKAWTDVPNYNQFTNGSPMVKVEYDSIYQLNKDLIVEASANLVRQATKDSSEEVNKVPGFQSTQELAAGQVKSLTVGKANTDTKDEKRGVSICRIKSEPPRSTHATVRSDPPLTM